MENRTKQVRKLLAEEKLDALLISSTHNIRYITGFDGFGEHEREGYALITNSNLYIFASPLAAEGARKKTKGSHVQVIELTAKKRLIPTLQEIITTEQIKILGFEENLTFAEYKLFKKLKNIKFKMTEEIVEEVRVVKDLNELQALQKACKLTDEAFSYVLKNIRIKMTEKEVAWIIEKYIREHGGELAFPTIVAFGKNSAIPHHVTSDAKLEENSTILLDFGAKVDGYHADMSRTIFKGRADDKFKKMYEAVRIGQDISFKSKQKKITGEGVDKIARDYIVSQEYPSVPHSVGHGVGLQVHELPHISPGFKETIVPNTPFTIEPGIYINGVGGVRIEDTVWYDGKEIISLTKSPKTLIELH